MKRILFIMLFSLALLVNAWETPVKIEGGTPDFFTEFTVVRFDYSGAAYIFYDHDPNLDLAKYDGKRVEHLGQVNKKGLKTYAPSMVVAKDGKIHMVWAEATSRLSTEYYIKYRTYENKTFSDVVQIAKLAMPGVPQSKHGPSKIEFIRIGVDNEENLFIVYYDSSRARCKFISVYNGVVKMEGWPSITPVRMKYPEVAAGDDFIHVVWQHGIKGSANYTCMWARRENKPDGKWQPMIDLKKGQHYVHSSHVPLVALDDKQDPHFVYMDDGRDGPGREVIYNTAIGTKLGEREFLSPNRGYPSNISLSMFDRGNGFIAGHKQTKVIFYDWKVNGVWKGFQEIPGTTGADGEWSDLSKDGKIAAVTFRTGWDNVWIVTSSKIVINLPPTVVINADNENPFSSDTVNFNANGSTDPDGSIVSYHWNFGDGVTAEGSQASHAFANKFGDVRVRLTITDDKGAVATASKIIKVKALFTATNITFTKKLIRTLLYDRNGYVINWTPNEKNAAAGYNIVGYKIFRKTVGDSGDYVEVGSVSSEKIGYIDVSIEPTGDKEYLYSVCPFDEQGHYSPVANF